MAARRRGSKRKGVSENLSSGRRGITRYGKTTNQSGRRIEDERSYRDQLVRQSSDEWGNFGKGGHRGEKSQERQKRARKILKESQARSRKKSSRKKKARRKK